MSFALGRRVLDKNNCKELSVVIDAFNDLHDALGNPVNNPGPGVDGTVPDLYTPVYADGDGNLTTGTVLTTVKIIKGDTTASVAGADFTIDGLVSLTEGFTVPAEPLSVNNTIGLSCGDNTPVFAVYNPTSTEWETWTDTTDASSTYYAGLGISLVANEFALYLGSYAGAGPELYGSIDGTFGMLTLKGWLEELGGYASATGDIQLIGHNEGNDPVWDGVSDWLETLDNFSDEDSQMIGAEQTTPRWYPMATLATGLINGAASPSTPFVDGDNFQTSGGATPPVTSETIQNTFGYGIDDNTPIVVMRASSGNIATALALEDDPPETSIWHLVAAEQPEIMLFEASVGATDPAADISVTNGDRLWGPDNTEPTTLENPFKFTPDLGAYVWGVRHPGVGSTWYALQATPTVLNVITDITSLTISGGNLVLTYRQQSINVTSINSASTEETITIPVTTC